MKTSKDISRVHVNYAGAGVHAPEAAERAGHGVDVMLKVYAKCIDGQREVANQRILDALAA